MSSKIIQVNERPPLRQAIPLSIQHMFAMFGASVLVPSVFGIDPAIVLFMNGVGTLLFILITKGRAPAYLGSSFAFLAAGGVVIQKYGFEYAQGGFVAVGICGCILALIVYKFGTNWIRLHSSSGSDGAGCGVDRVGVGFQCSQQCGPVGREH